jgi:hypothetical protein
MAFDESNGNGMYMPVAPAYSGGNGGFGGFGGDWGWIILLLLCGWGGMGFGGGFGGGYGNMMLGYDFPWLLNNTNSGFDHAATQSALGDLNTAVTTGFGNVATQLCGGFAGVNATVNNAQNALAQQMYTNTIADLERSYAAQTASTAGMNGIAMNLQNCCCENRAATADLKYTIATENCADRATISDGIRDLLTATTANTQRILDQMCNDKIDAKNEKIADLERQLTMANLAASQGAQTAAILANNEAQTTALEQYLAPVPRPAYIVQNPNCCTNTCGCGCGIA